MDQVWWVALLWALVGLAGVIIATWLGGSLRDEFFTVRRQLGPPKLRLIRGGKFRIAVRPGVQVESGGVIAVRGGRPVE